MKKILISVILAAMLPMPYPTTYAADTDTAGYQTAPVSDDNMYYIFYKDIDTAEIDEEVEEKRHAKIYALFDEGLSQYEVDRISNDYCQEIRLEFLKAAYREASAKVIAELGIDDPGMFRSALAPLIVCRLSEEQLRIAESSENISDVTVFHDFSLSPDILYDRDSFIEMLTVDNDGKSVLGDGIKTDAILNSGVNNDTDFLIVYGLSDTEEISQVINQLNTIKKGEWVTPIEIMPFSGQDFDFSGSSIISNNRIKLIVFVNDVTPGLTADNIGSYSAGVGFDARPYVINRGDTNGDYILDARDASDILSVYAELSTNSSTVLSAEEKAVMDVDGDGKVDSADASKILSYYAYTSTDGKGLFGEWLNAQKP